MIRTRHGWLVVVLGLGFVTACKKDAASAKDVDDLSLLPADSEFVVGVNVAQVEQSALWKQNVEPTLMSGDAQRKLTEFKDACGFDPISSLTSVAAGVKANNNKPEGIVVLHGWNKAKVWACFENDKMKARMAKNGEAFSRDGDVGVYQGKSGNQFAVAWVNDTTGLVVIGDQVTADRAKAAVAGGSALKSSAQFGDMYSKINTGDSLWFLARSNEQLFGMMAMMGVKPKTLFGSLNVTDHLALALRMRFEKPEEATKLVDQIKPMLPTVAPTVDKIDVTSEGPDAKVAVELSAEKLRALFQQYGGMLHAVIGGGGG